MDADRGAQRASDADREAVAARLRDALAEGRLDIDEYSQRLDETFRATTYGELEPLTRDLPVVAGTEPAGAEPAGRRKRIGDEWRAWAGTAVILNAIWLITSLASAELVFYWPMFPLGIWAAVNLASLLWGDDES